MPWDLQISNFSDLMFGPSRDWQPITGEELLKQRIILRLRMQRGSWILDDSGDLGSNLHFTLRMQQPVALEELDTLVTEALEPMSDEITVLDIEVKPSEVDINAIDLLVTFQRVLPSETQTQIAASQILLSVSP
jgi:phage gp46-like protein